MKDNLSTPMMRQYMEVKSKLPDKMLFFRVGDFYELFGEDAKLSAPIMGIALTSRDKTIPMCGVPYHSVSQYISKLTAKGISVAICEQVEDPKLAKGIVKREIVKVITPSLVYDSSTLDAKNYSYLLSIVREDDLWGFSYIDYSTGEFKASSTTNVDELLREVVNLEPKEIIYESSIPDVLSTFLPNISYSLVKKNYNFEFRNIIVDTRLSSIELKAAKLVFNYLVNTQFRDEFPHVRYLSKINSSKYLILDEFTSRNLDLFNSFLKAIDFTITAMGGRKIRKAVAQPFRDLDSINNRLNDVEIFVNNLNTLNCIRTNLKKCSDIERLVAKVAVSQYSPRDFKTLLESLVTSIEIIKEISTSNLKSFEIIDTEDFLNYILERISFLEDKQPFSINDGEIFKKGFNKELDDLIDLHVNSKKFLIDMEREEKQRTKISSLKIRYNKIFGYYIDVTKANLHLVPNNYIRKQTLVNNERFITEELKVLEEKLINAENRRRELERNLLEEIVNDFKKYIDSALSISNMISEIDLISSFAWCALNRNYIRPEIHNGFDLVLENAKHPVLLELLGDRFIANDTNLISNNFFHIITGPNMAGKSTLMRTVALLTIMAHMGSFIPASYASIPLTDQVFTRVGATDYILQGQSTFMVEMIEASNIISSATKNSLIILDEIGRGTSTYDGISIAWAIAEYIHDKIGSKCMFATHYHELTVLEKELKNTANYSMDVEEEKEGLFFIRKVVNRPASKSYGIQVASMAGVPKEVINRAYSIMNDLEKDRVNYGEKEVDQLNLFNIKENKEHKKIISDIKELDFNNITPIEALNRIYKWKEKIDDNA